MSQGWGYMFNCYQQYGKMRAIARFYETRSPLNKQGCRSDGETCSTSINRMDYHGCRQGSFEGCRQGCCEDYARDVASDWELYLTALNRMNNQVCH